MTHWEDCVNCTGCFGLKGFKGQCGDWGGVLFFVNMTRKGWPWGGELGCRKKIGMVWVRMRSKKGEVVDKPVHGGV